MSHEIILLFITMKFDHNICNLALNKTLAVLSEMIKICNSMESQHFENDEFIEKLYYLDNIEK